MLLKLTSPPWLIAYGFLLTFPACGMAQTASHHLKPQPGNSKLNFHKDIQPIFDANCVVCHQTGGTQGGLNLEDGESYGATVMRNSEESKLLRIAPGRPKESYLIHKLEGSHIEAGGTGEQMPTTGPLDKGSIQILRRWIQEGARKD
ncbi:hypothetical protein [Ferribacterium limneticum]|uniref:hypothetical protein n=1 Tax=Ferribacterium limneticum TaxID=76259 RepID=UPI001CFA27D8|nr:hypothetical protein [Ferribacterium limneticum]UCV17833.1 hypothetical protein KI610_13520 [Ferribacterium limneticum]